MVGPYCFTPILACRLRVALLDAGGAPDDGPDAMVVTDALVRIGYQLVVTAGAKFQKKNGCGKVCLDYQGQDRIDSVNLTLELCSLDFELVALMTQADTDVIGGETRGIALPQVDADLTRRVSVEAWAEAFDVDQPLTDSMGNVGYLRTIFPSTSWVESDREYKEDASPIILTGHGRSNANFGDGPGNDLTWGMYTSPKGEFLDFGDLPEATCGTQALVAS